MTTKQKSSAKTVTSNTQGILHDFDWMAWWQGGYQEALQYFDGKTFQKLENDVWAYWSRKGNYLKSNPREYYPREILKMKAYEQEPQ